MATICLLVSSAGLVAGSHRISSAILSARVRGAGRARGAHWKAVILWRYGSALPLVHYPLPMQLSTQSLQPACRWAWQVRQGLAQH